MGGNVFGNTDRIKKEDIKPTLLRFFKEFKQLFPEAEPHFMNIKLLGSAGKKDYSGDIDLGLSETSFGKIEDWNLDVKHVEDLFALFKKRARTASDAQLLKRAVIVAIAEKIEQSDTEIYSDVKGSGAGVLFLKFPQYNKEGAKIGTNVQIDVNVGNLDWLTFAYHSNSYSGNVKGLHRTQLMLSMFANKGYVFSHNYGVKNKETQETVATSPQQAVELLNSLYDLELDQETVSDYFKLLKVLKTQLPKQELNKILDIYLKILDSTRADIPENLQQYWIDNQQRLGLKGKLLPNDSNLYQYMLEEDSEKGSKIFIPRRLETREEELRRSVYKRVQNYIKDGNVGDFSLANMPITSFPENLTEIGGDLNLVNTDITSLPDNLTVTGILDLYNTHITTILDDIRVKRFIVMSKVPTSYPEHLKSKIYVKGRPLTYWENLKKKQDDIKKMPIVSLSVGTKQRKGQGIKGTYETLKDKLSTVSSRNLEKVAEILEIKWGDMIIYFVAQAYSQGEPKIRTGFAVLGKDREGREYLYDRKETESPGAGQTELVSPYRRIQTSYITGAQGRKTYSSAIIKALMYPTYSTNRT